MPKDVEELSAASAGSTAVGLTPYYTNGRITIYHGDCLEVMPQLHGIGLVFTSRRTTLAVWETFGRNTVHIVRRGVPGWYVESGIEMVEPMFWTPLPEAN